ncbi:DUF2784 domain-containing protein [Microbispora bryophytorum]|uniref:DUF2784 domain-containing protein n=1 Tax=Microbispora bryophytorum TaxID=1460882 RepID=A0A8H9LDS5_9ACTN|nr:DUF2784 domain-containing protein [Microbispora bryophytorum]MBD3134751.1 DUF2784 domain-containing protein [Microbispora bryophytorum]TQS08978.1 DUF2784 domain-containing protein [Microbispora bryophytorum]GGO12504.1 hypothetical protein GCM10011574_31020 [Microbispora bryophytorum]
MIYRLVWQATMAAHFLVIAYIALGGFLAWRRPRLIWPHLALCAWGLVQLAGLAECPLTALENWGRAGAGERGLLPGGFIDTYIEGVVYPEAYVWHVRCAVIAVVLVSWAGLAIRIRRRRTRPGRTTGTPAAPEPGALR